MKKEIFMISILILSTVGMTTTGTMQVDATQDTFTSSIEDINYGNLDHVNLSFKQNSSLYVYDSMYKFPTSLMSNYIVQNVTMNWYIITPATLQNPCSINGCYRRIAFFPDQTWNENLINNTNEPLNDSFFIGNITHGNSLGWKESSILTRLANGSTGIKTQENISTFLNSLYNSSNLSLYISNTIFTPGTGGNASISSSEGSFKPHLNITYSDYAEGYATYTDLNGYYFFDFEHGFAKTSIFDAFDFTYASVINSIASYTSKGISIAPSLADTQPDNDLITKIQDCYFQRNYNTTSTYSPNTIVGLYNYYCFNLSSQHNGKRFFGIIKVINATNVRGNSSIDFDFYWAISSPTYNTFSQPSYIPNPPRLGLNLTITWTSTIPMTTKLYYRYNQSGLWSAWSEVNP